ncbi:MAG: succinylglutamate desuccinylase/aspartoacylase family protein [Halothiobacillaceae bacterium]
MPARTGFVLGGEVVPPGSRRTVDLPVSTLSDHTPVTLSVHVVHGRRPGPTVFVSAAVHGDEILGVEIVRRLLRASQLKTLRGTLMAVPIVNSFGFMNHSRYLPDRRDLNRSFPGSPRGSLAARLAHRFMEQVVSRCDLGIDLHTAAIHRSNLPQIRVTPSKPDTLELARAFGAPVVLTAPLRAGSLREAAMARDVDVLLYEAGEALRFDEFAVRAGVTGCLRVFRETGMIPARGISRPRAESLFSHASNWVRAPAGGLLRSYRNIGDVVEEGAVLGVLSDPFGEIDIEVRASDPGLIIGRTNLPVVHEGDALFHIARLRARAEPEATLESLTAQLEGEPMFDEDEII